MVYSRSFDSIPIAVTSPESDWSYAQLSDIEILETAQGHYARLICEHDCGGEMFTAICSQRNFVYLEPYARLLAENKADPIGIEKPVIPVYFRPDGRAFLSTSGARLDFPDLPAPRTKVYLRPRRTPEDGSSATKSGLAWLQSLFRL
ncbi:MAG: hypothetical protein ACO3PY_05780 [Pontimonas sp.]